MPRSSKKSPNTTTRPTTTEKAPVTKSKADQKRGQKRGAGDLISDVVGLGLGGDNEQACPPAKKGKPSTKHSEHATDRTVPRPVGMGSRGQTTKNTATGVESKVDGVRSGVAKRQIVANSDVGTDTDRNPKTPCRPAKKVKTQGIQRTGMFTHHMIRRHD